MVENHIDKVSEGGRGDVWDQVEIAAGRLLGILSGAQEGVNQAGQPVST